MMQDKNAIVWRIEKGMQGLIKAASRQSLVDNAHEIYVQGLARMSTAISNGDPLVGPYYDDSQEVSARAWHDLWWESKRSVK